MEKRQSVKFKHFFSHAPFKRSRSALCCFPVMMSLEYRNVLQVQNFAVTKLLCSLRNVALASLIEMEAVRLNPSDGVYM